MHKLTLLVFVIVSILGACNKEQTDSGVTKDQISGYVQKGPFLNGSGILVNELNSDLSQTGKVYSTQIVNRNGLFELINLQFVSNYVGIRADGFYFNEITNEKSGAQLTLYALSDVSDSSSINVNVLTHLEKARVVYLISKGAEFKEAKKQALNEILSFFGANDNDEFSSEYLDISKTGENNSALLAASLLIQGFRTESEMSELLSNMSSDLEKDGSIDDAAIGSQIMNHAVYLDTISIKDNLQKRYEEQGLDAEIPNFGKYVGNFVQQSGYPITNMLIEYPEEGSFGPNILDLKTTKLIGANYSLTAFTTGRGKVRVRITVLKGKFDYARGELENWEASSFELTNPIEFTSVIPGIKSNAHVVLNSGSYLIEYFEMGSSYPTKSKIIENDYKMIYD